MYNVKLNDEQINTIKHALNIALYNSKNQNESDNYHEVLDILNKYKNSMRR